MTVRRPGCSAEDRVGGAVDLALGVEDDRFAGPEVPVCGDRLAVLEGCSGDLDATWHQSQFRHGVGCGSCDALELPGLGIDFENPTSAAVTVDGRLVARDANGAALPGVRVTTAFGTESRRAVVLPGANVDFVQLEGHGEQQVRKITLESADVTVLDVSPETQYVELKSLDGDGRELNYDTDAQKVSLENPNPFPVRIRVVLMILAAPRQGVPQEATLVQDVTTMEAEASGSTVVPLDAGTRRLLRQHGSTSFVTLRPVLAP